MSICDNPLLFSMKRQHHCLNMGKVPFFTVEVNDTIFKLISGEKEACKSSLSCCFDKVHHLKIMNSKDYGNHETLSGDTKKKNHLFQQLSSEASTKHQQITVIYEIPRCPVWLTGQGRAPSRINYFKDTALVCRGEWLLCPSLAPVL